MPNVNKPQQNVPQPPPQIILTREEYAELLRNRPTWADTFAKIGTSIVTNAAGVATGYAAGVAFAQAAGTATQAAGGLVAPAVRALAPARSAQVISVGEKTAPVIIQSLSGLVMNKVNVRVQNRVAEAMNAPRRAPVAEAVDEDTLARKLGLLALASEELDKTAKCYEKATKLLEALNKSKNLTDEAAVNAINAEFDAGLAHNKRAIEYLTMRANLA